MKTKKTICVFFFLLTLTISFNLTSYATASIEDNYVSGIPKTLFVAKGWSARFEGYVISTGNLTKVTAAITLPDDEHDHLSMPVNNKSIFDLSELPPFDSKKYEKHGLDNYRVGIWAKSENIPDPQDPIHLMKIQLEEPEIIINLEGDHNRITDAGEVNIKATATECDTPNFVWESTGGQIINHSSKSDNPNLITWKPPDVNSEKPLYVRCTFSPTDAPNNKFKHFVTQKYNVVVSPDEPVEPETPEAPELKLYSINEQSKPEIRLRWQKILDFNMEHNADHYQFQCAVDPENITQNTKLTVFPEVTGDSIFERFNHTIDSCNGNLLNDDTTYYLRISGVKQSLEGAWSEIKSVTINIQDFPYFDESYQEPDNEQSDVPKKPILRWKALDKDNDDLDFYVTLGTDKDNLFTKRYFRSEKQGQSEYNVAEESGKPLLPGKEYFWQIWVREIGKTDDDYGGEYIKSPIWSFTTELKGSDPAIVDFEQIGEIQPNSSVIFKLKIQNKGSETAEPQYIRSDYIKNGKTFDFLNGEGDMKQYLEPNQEEYVEIELFFRDEVIEKYGTVYDNILISGSSQIKFYFDYPDKNDISLTNNELVVPINYTDTYKPEITYFHLYAIGITDITDYFWAIREKPLLIALGTKDNDALSKIIYEYRPNQSSDWDELYTEMENLKQTSFSYTWDIQENLTLTDTAQIRVRIYDNKNNQQEVISDPFPIYSNNTSATIETSKTLLKTGDSLEYSISFSSENTIEFVEILLEAGSNYTYLKRFNPGGASGGQYQWTIPSGYISKNCYLILTLTDNRGNENEFRSDKFEIRDNTELPEPFKKAITLYDNEFTFPSGSVYRDQNQEIIFTRLDNNNKVHCIVAHDYEYYQNTASGNYEDTFIGVNNKYYTTYDPDSKQISNPELIADKDYQVLDFTIFDDKPFIVFKKKNCEQLYYQYKNGSSFTSPKIIENSRVPKVSNVSKRDSDSYEFIGYPGRCVYLNNYLWENDTVGTNKIWKYPYVNGDFGEGELVVIQNNAGSTESMLHINPATDGNNIYFIDDTGSRLIKFNTDSQPSMTAYQLPVTLSDDEEDLYKVALIAMNDKVFLFANAKVYLFNGSSVVEKADIAYTINNQTLNYAQDNKWDLVDWIKAIKTETGIYLIIDQSRPDYSMTARSKYQKILKFDTSNASFSVQVVDTEDNIHVHDYKQSEDFDLTYLSDNKVVVAFGLDEEQSSDLHNYYSFIKMLDIETGQVDYLGPLSFKTNSRVTLINSNGTIYAVASNSETGQIDSYRIDFTNINDSKKQLDDVQFISLENNLYVTWGNGSSYNGTWNTEKNQLNNDVLKKNIARQIYPQETELIALSDGYINGKLNTYNNYISTPKMFEVYLWQQDTNSAQKILDIDNYNSSTFFSLKFFQTPYIAGFQEYLNPGYGIILLKEDQSQTSLNFSFQQGMGALFGDEAVFIGNNPHSSNKTVLSKYNYSSQISTGLILNDTGSYRIDIEPEKVDINQNKYVAVSWDNVLAVGDLSKDMILPEITFTHVERTVKQGDTLILSWNASDNIQLQKIEIYKESNGSFDLLSTIEDMTTSTYPFQVTNSGEITFKAIAYDIDNNTASDSTRFDIISPITFQSFTASPSEVGIGDSLNFSWNTNNAEAASEYTICVRKSGDTAWKPCISAKGLESESIVITQKPGKYEYIIFSRDDSRMAEVTVTGEYIEFSPLDFNPTQILYYVYDAIVQFNWDIKNNLSDIVHYTLLIKKENEDIYQPIETITDTSYLFYLSETISSFSWMIDAEYLGNHYLSDEYNVQLKELLSCQISSVKLIDNHTSSPYIVIDFEPVADAEQYEVIRRDRKGNEEKITLSTDYNKFTDAQIQYGEKYQYSISSIKGNLTSESEESDEIIVDIIEPLGVTIHTPGYQVLDSNEITIEYSPTPDLCYENYEIMYSQDNMDTFELYTKTNQRQVTLNDLNYSTVYYVKVQPKNFNDQRVGRFGIIQFTTGMIQPPDVSINLNVNIENNTANLSWTINNESNSDIAGIDIQRKLTGGNFQSVYKSDEVITIYNDTNLEPGIYYYRIYAYNSGGASEPSNEISITIDPECNFPPKYSVKGNPADATWTLYIENATIDDTPLEPGDEIGIFDGEKLVGAFRLTQPLSPESVFENNMTAWSTLDDGPGYRPGNKYNVKFWDCSEEDEFSGKIVYSEQYPDAYTGNVFPSNDGEFSIVSMNFNKEVIQLISLKTAYQIISFNVHLELSAREVFSTISSCLDFVRDSNGNMVRKIGDQLIDNIKNITAGEAYLVKMHCPMDLIVIGTPLDSQISIDMSSSDPPFYRLVGYLPDKSFTALNAFESILDTLEFIRNSNGQMLRKIGDNWIDNIGSMNPGEGFLVKMNDNATLVYPTSTSVRSKRVRSSLYESTNSMHFPVVSGNSAYESTDSTHFPVISGNPASKVWTVYFKDIRINDQSLKAEDEIAVYDGEKMVGSVIFNEDVNESNWENQYLTVWSGIYSDNDGYQPGNTFYFKCWNQQKELSNYKITWNTDGGSYQDNIFPDDDGQYSVMTIDFEYIPDPWQSPQLVINNSNRQFFAEEPVIVTDDLNCVHLVYIGGFHDTGQRGIFYKKLNSDGKWSTFHTIQSYRSDYLSNVRLKIDSSNMPHVIWVSENNEVIYYSQYNGVIWTNPKNISFPTTDSYYPDFVIDSDDNIHVVFEGNDSVYYVQSNAEIWSTPVQIVQQESFPAKIGITHDRNLMVIYNNQTLRSFNAIINQGSDSWSEPVVLNNSNYAHADMYATDRSTHIIIPYDKDLKRGVDYFVYDGVNFISEKILGGEPFYTKVKLCVTSNNIPQIVWQEDSSPDRVFYMQKLLSGWTNKIKISLDSGPPNYDISFSISSNNILSVAWDGSNDEYAEIFYNSAHIDYNSAHINDLYQIIILLQELVGIHSGQLKTNEFINARVGLEDVLYLLKEVVK